jgi:Protein of unknown function (DUF3800)
MEVDIYCDESRQDLLTSKSPAADYFLIGGLWVERERRAEFNAELRALRRKHNVGGEFKWHKVSPSRIGFYEDAVDLFLGAGESMRFRCVVVDRNAIDMGFHDNDPELGYYKFYYQLLHHWLVPGDSYAIYCDLRSNRLKTRQRTLERVLRRANPGATIERIQGVVSSEVALVQLSDLLLGAASTRLNGRILSPSKEALVSRLEGGLGLQRGLGATWKSERKYNVFGIQLGRQF